MMVDKLTPAAVLQTSGLIAVGILITRFVIHYYRWLRSPLRKIPGPPVPSYFFGYMMGIWREPYLKLHKRWWSNARNKYNDDVPLLAYGMPFGSFSVHVLDVNLVQKIMTSQVNSSPLRFPRYESSFLRVILGDGLITLEGPEWHRHRRILQSSFYTSALKKALDVSVPKHTQRFIQAWRHGTTTTDNTTTTKHTTQDHRGRVIDLSTHLSALTIDILGDVAFSHNFDALKTVECWSQKDITDDDDEKLEAVDDPLIMALNECFKPSLLSLVFNVLQIGYASKYLNPSYRRACKLLDGAVDDVIKAARCRRRRGGESKHSNREEEEEGVEEEESTKSLLQTIFEAEDTQGSPGTKKTLTDRELRDEVKTFIVAGHETTSTLCYWALYALAKFPSVERRVYEDIMKHSNGTDMEKPIHMDEVNEMSYLSAFINEVLRLYPPAGVVNRKTAKDETFGKYTIPSGTKLFIPIHLIHRHPDHWTKPLEFMPERWLDKDAMKARHRYSYLPFGAGGHNCIGQNFAIMEGKLMLANIIRAFTIEMAPSLRNTEIEFTSIVTLKGKPSVKICIKAR